MSTCQSCGRRPAVVQFIQVNGDERRELSLCQECALSVGMRAQVEAFQRLSRMFLEQQLSLPNLSDETRAALSTVCSNCGLVFEEFIQTGLLGCPQCYQDFHALLQPILRRMHGVIKQRGDEPLMPITPPEIRDELASETREQIEMELHLALLEEDYEKAARLRDKLKHL
jgi:protein arginine kinase activator